MRVCRVEVLVTARHILHIRDVEDRVKLLDARVISIGISHKVDRVLLIQVEHTAQEVGKVVIRTLHGLLLR